MRSLMPPATTSCAATAARTACKIGQGIRASGLIVGAGVDAEKAARRDSAELPGARATLSAARRSGRRRPMSLPARWATSTAAGDGGIAGAAEHGHQVRAGPEGHLRFQATGIHRFHIGDQSDAAQRAERSAPRPDRIA